MRTKVQVKTALLVAALLAPGPTFLSPALFSQTLNSTFAELDRAAPSFKAMTADIKRVIHTAAINDDSNDDGSMKLKRTKKDTKMLIVFTGKEAKTVSLEGQTFKIFYPKTNTIQYWDLGKNRSLVDQFLLLGFGATSEDLKSAYSITWAGEETVEGQKTGHIVLVPKAADVLKKLKRAELWIWDAKGVPLRQKFVTSMDGDSTMVTYSNLKTNAAIPDNDLQLREPKGVHKEYPQKN